MIKQIFRPTLHRHGSICKALLFNTKMSHHNNRRTYTSAIQKPLQLVSKEEYDTFMGVYPIVEKHVTATYFRDMPSVITERFLKGLSYNLTYGKKYRGLTVVSSYKLLRNSENIAEEDIQLACILGWCVEMAQATGLIVDDILDESEYRRGMPCWYKLPEVGLQAINDSFMLENAIYALLQKHFSNHAFYTSIVELFHETFFRNALGQMLDSEIASNKKPYLETFDLDTYNLLVFNKTTYYSIILTITAPIYLAMKYDPELYTQLFPIFKKIGLLFQVKDDFLDCFGNYEKMGKEGSDIRNGKRSWLAITALQHATQNQKKVFEQHYGKNMPDSEKKVRDLYLELRLRDIHSQYEKDLLNSIHSDISKISNEQFPHNILLNIIEKLATYSEHYTM